MAVAAGVAPTFTGEAPPTSSFGTQGTASSEPTSHGDITADGAHATATVHDAIATTTVLRHTTSRITIG